MPPAAIFMFYTLLFGGGARMYVHRNLGPLYPTRDADVDNIKTIHKAGAWGSYVASQLKDKRMDLVGALSMASPLQLIADYRKLSALSTLIVFMNANKLETDGIDTSYDGWLRIEQANKWAGYLTYALSLPGNIPRVIKAHFDADPNPIRTCFGFNSYLETPQACGVFIHSSGNPIRRRCKIKTDGAGRRVCDLHMKMYTRKMNEPKVAAAATAEYALRKTKVSSAVATVLDRQGVYEPGIGALVASFLPPCLHTP